MSRVFDMINQPLKHVVQDKYCFTMIYKFALTLIVCLALKALKYLKNGSKDCEALKDRRIFIVKIYDYGKS